MTTRRSLMGVAAVAALAFTGTPPTFAADLVIGTSSPGGSYFLMGGGLSTTITRDLPGINISTRTTAGSTTNVRVLAQPDGGLQLGLANLGAVYDAVNAKGKFTGQKPASNISALISLEISPLHWVSLEKDNIKSFADLKGKRVSFAKAGSGTAANAELVLKTLGVRDQVKPQFLGFSEAADAVRDGNLDVFAVASGVPVPAITSLSASRKVRLIPLAATELKSILALNPAFASYLIKASSYSGGVVADAQSYGTPSTLMVQDGVQEDVVYRIVKHIFTDKHKSYMKTVYKSWDPTPGTEAFKNAGVKHHPGALKAFKELGLK